MLAPHLVAGQYEDCHYECSVAHCDYYDDYCDYDCYEVCYPYRSLRAESVRSKNAGTDQQEKIPASWEAETTSQVQQGGKLYRRVESKSTSPLIANGPKSMVFVTTEPVRMRLRNPTFQTVQRGQVVRTRGSPPKSFAMFQSCLSNRTNRNWNRPS